MIPMIWWYLRRMLADWKRLREAARPYLKNIKRIGYQRWM